MSERTIDIIVPVYRGEQTTRRCIESVLAAPCVTAMRLVVVDDKTPEPDLHSWLVEKSDRGELDLIINQENLGFVRSVNQAMALHLDRDAVLLNSDCEVANDWLDRLVEIAQANPRVGTITPLSNNATICSYPIPATENPLPAGWTLTELDALAAETNDSDPVSIPTAVGSCMYVRRECWNELGGFDADTFGLGYGEECDFSLRAARAGWHNVAATNVFVYHEGSVSFGASRLERVAQAEALVLARHPDYGIRVTQFIEKDPLAGHRLALSQARARRDHPAACAVVKELALESGKRYAALIEKLDHYRSETRRSLEAVRILEAELERHQAVCTELRDALDQAEGFVRERETDIADLIAERDALITEHELLCAELQKMRRRSPIYLTRRAIARVGDILNMKRPQ